MVKARLFTIFLIFLTGCTANPALEIQPNDQVTMEIPGEMFSAIRMRQGELLFLKDEKIIGFVKSDQIPETLSQGSEHPEQILFDSASEGSQKPAWLQGVPKAKAFWVTGDYFTTIFIVPDNSPNTLVTFQGPHSYTDAVRINNTNLQRADAR